MQLNTSSTCSSASRGNQRNFHGIPTARNPSKQSRKPWPLQPSSTTPSQEHISPSPQTPVSWPWGGYLSRGGRMVGNHWGFGVPNYNPISNSGLHMIGSFLQPFEGSDIFDPWSRVALSPFILTIFHLSLRCLKRQMLRQQGRCISYLWSPSLRLTFDTSRARVM